MLLKLFSQVDFLDLAVQRAQYTVKVNTKKGVAPLFGVLFYKITRGEHLFSYKCLTFLPVFVVVILRISMYNRTEHSKLNLSPDMRDFQQCGMCDQQSSDQNAHVRSLFRAFC